MTRLATLQGLVRSFLRLGLMFRKLALPMSVMQRDLNLVTFLASQNVDYADSRANLSFGNKGRPLYDLREEQP